MLVVWWALQAQAATPAQVMARLEEVRPLREQRIDAQAPLHPAEVYTRAIGGEVVTGSTAVEGHKAKKIWGVAVFEVPIGRLWSAVNDDPSKVEWTKLDFLEVIGGRACGAPRRVFQFASIPLVTDRWWIVDVRYNEALQAKTGGRVREQRWATDGDFTTPTPATTAWAAKGMHIESTVGSWFLVDVDGHTTVVEYTTWSDPGGSIPAGMASSLAASGVDDTLSKMAELAQHGTVCKLD